jgi:hypothetical protein
MNHNPIEEFVQRHPNGNRPLEIQQPTYPRLELNVQPTSMTVTVLAAPNIAMSQVAIDEVTMNAVCRDWLAKHEALMNELVAESIAAKKNQLAIIKHVKDTRVN